MIGFLFWNQNQLKSYYQEIKQKKNKLKEKETSYQLYF